MRGLPCKCPKLVSILLRTLFPIFLQFPSSRIDHPKTESSKYRRPIIPGDRCSPVDSDRPSQKKRRFPPMRPELNSPRDSKKLRSIVKSCVTEKAGPGYRVIACQLCGDPYFPSWNVSQPRASRQHVCTDAPRGSEATNQTEIRFSSLR